MTQRGVFRDSVLGLCLALAMLVAVEIALRAGASYSDQPFSQSGMSDMVFEPHPLYKVGLKPGLARSFQRKEGGKLVITGWSTNSRSFRGPEVQADRPALRVVVYGDSNVFAQFSNDEATFPAKLQVLLREATQNNVEVLNAGVPGFGPDQSYLRMEQEIDSLKPDIVILHVFADNDFGDVIRNRLFKLGPSESLVRLPQLLQPDPCLTRDPTCFPSMASNRIENALSSLAIVQTGRSLFRQVPIIGGWADPSPSSVIQAYLRLCENEYRLYQGTTAGQTSHFADHYDFDVALFPASESARTKVKLMKGLLTLAQSLAEAKRTKLLVVIQPSSMDLTTHLSPNYRDFSAFAAYRKDGLTNLVEQSARQHNIDVVNLFPLFAEHNPQQLFLPNGDDHWSDAGQQLAAQTVAGMIKNRYLDPAKVQPPPSNHQQDRLLRG